MIIFKKILVVLIVIACFMIAFALYKVKKMEHDFLTIKIGLSQSDVVELLGEPELVLIKGEVSKEYASVFMRNNPRIETGYFYLSKYTPQFYAIGFDEKGVVNDKYNFVSY